MTRKQQESGVPEPEVSIMQRVSVVLWLVAVLTYLLLMTRIANRTLNQIQDSRSIQRGVGSKQVLCNV